MVRPKEEQDYPTPGDLQDWLRQEVMDTAKAAELRLNEATSLVTDYAKGKITAKEATTRWHSYNRRWGDAIPGVSSEGKTDAEIYREMDRNKNAERKFTADVRRSQAQVETRRGQHSR
jgi:hypothetical protein